MAGKDGSIFTPNLTYYYKPWIPVKLNTNCNVNKKPFFDGVWDGLQQQNILYLIRKRHNSGHLVSIDLFFHNMLSGTMDRYVARGRQEVIKQEPENLFFDRRTTNIR